MKRKLYLETFGCQMNVLDSELVLGQLRAHGYESVDSHDDADVSIYNTCSVREHAEQKVWSRLGELRERKRSEPGLVIGVIGCMAERDGTNIFQKFPQVDVLCGPGELDKLPALVHNAVVTSRDGASDASDAPAARPLAPSRREKQVAPMGANTPRSRAISRMQRYRRCVIARASAATCTSRRSMATTESSSS